MRWQARVACLAMLSAAACGSGDTKSDADYEAAIMTNTFQLIKLRVNALHQAALDLQSFAPTPADRGWDATLDAAMLVQMKNSWKAMRTAWESSEGVLSPLFPSLDDAMDSRFEDHFDSNETDLFDGSGVIGMHAIERILYAPDAPLEVIAEENTVAPGAPPPAWPSTPDQAAEFKTGLCQKLVDDSAALVVGWKPTAIKLSDAFAGITGLMSAQAEKVNSAASHEEESRYSQSTMSDMRENLNGTTDIYSLFTEWISTKPNGSAINTEVEEAFDGLSQVYAGVEGDAVPPPPSDWNLTTPSPANQQTPFGFLYLSVVQAVDPSRTGSVVNAMNHAARSLGLPEFAGTPQ